MSSGRLLRNPEVKKEYTTIGVRSLLEVLTLFELKQQVRTRVVDLTTDRFSTKSCIRTIYWYILNVTLV